MALNPSPYETLKETDEPIAIVVDSTSVKVHWERGWVERKHEKKKRYVKYHIAVNAETKEVVAMELSTDDVHDIKIYPGLVDEAKRRRRITW